MSLDIQLVRQQFPALKRPVIYFDNPGGTQVARQSAERMQDYLLQHNANHEGAFATSRESDQILHEAHAAAADFLNAARPDEIVFGNNMTTLTLHISRSLAKWLKPGDKIAVTRLDHDANVSPWRLIAQDTGCELLWVDFRTEDGTLDLDSLQQVLDQKPRILAVGYASNALGTINPLEKIISQAKAAGVLTYIDAVQYAPHGAIDVQALGCDFLVCSSYKFFGPHAGVLYGRYELLEELFPYKVRPAPAEPPGKFETGTQNHEGIAGVLGAIEYIQWLGEQFGQGFPVQGYTGRRALLKQGMAALQAYETGLSRSLLEMLCRIPGLRLYGLQDPQRLAERVPTYSFRLQDQHPRQVAEALDRYGINVWDGNYYALSVTEMLGIEDKGGMVRVGPVHYNTIEEVAKLEDALREIAR